MSTERQLERLNLSFKIRYKNSKFKFNSNFNNILQRGEITAIQKR